MSFLSIEEVTERFPHFRVAFDLAEQLTIAPERPPRLMREIAAAEDECRRRWAGMELAAIPEVNSCRTGLVAAAPRSVAIGKNCLTLRRRTKTDPAVFDENWYEKVRKALRRDWGGLAPSPSSRA